MSQSRMMWREIVSTARSDASRSTTERWSGGFVPSPSEGATGYLQARTKVRSGQRAYIPGVLHAGQRRASRLADGRVKPSVPGMAEQPTGGAASGALDTTELDHSHRRRDPSCSSHLNQLSVHTRPRANPCAR